MRGIRRASLLAVLPLLVAATCVTQTAQRGPEGPWVADVVNTGNQPVNGVSVAARVVDATGRELGVYSAFACPHVIEPGARGTAEIFAAWDSSETILPVHADFIPAGSDGPVAFTSAAVTARVMEQHPERRFAIVEIRNDSTGAASLVGHVRSIAPGRRTAARSWKQPRVPGRASSWAIDNGTDLLQCDAAGHHRIVPVGHGQHGNELHRTPGLRVQGGPQSHCPRTRQ